VPGSSLFSGLLLLDLASICKVDCVECRSDGLPSTGLPTGLLFTMRVTAPTSVNEVCSVHTADDTSLERDDRENKCDVQPQSSTSSADFDRELRRDDCKLDANLRKTFFIYTMNAVYELEGRLKVHQTMRL
jgi:hypothetical protein